MRSQRSQARLRMGRGVLGAMVSVPQTMAATMIAPLRLPAPACWLQPAVLSRSTSWLVICIANTHVKGHLSYSKPAACSAWSPLRCELAN